MKLPYLSVFAFTALIASTPCEAASPTTRRIVPHGSSPSGQIRWAARNSASKDGAYQWHIMLYPKAAASADEGVPLCESMSVGVRISADDQWILVEDGGPSLGIHLRLFKQTQGLHYVEQKTDLDDAVEKSLAHSPVARNANPTLLDHTYLHCLGWSPDGKASLEFSGHGAENGKRIEINSWACSFNPKTLTVLPGAPASLAEPAQDAASGPKRPK